MAVFLLKLVFSLLSALSGLITRVIFTTTARVVVQMIQALKVQGEGSQRVLEQIMSMIRACLEYLLDLIIKAIGAVLSGLFDLVKEGVLTTSSGFAAAVAGLVEKLKTSLDEAVQEIPEVVEAFTKMAVNIVSDLWKNLIDSITYVSDNVLK